MIWWQIVGVADRRIKTLEEPVQGFCGRRRAESHTVLTSGNASPGPRPQKRIHSVFAEKRICAMAARKLGENDHRPLLGLQMALVHRIYSARREPLVLIPEELLRRN